MPSKFSLKLGSRNRLCQPAGLQFPHLITCVSTIKSEDSSYRIHYTGLILSPSKLWLSLITRYLTIQFNFRFHGAHSFYNLIVNKYILYHQPRSESTDYSSSLREDPYDPYVKRGDLLRREMLRFWRNNYKQGIIYWNGIQIYLNQCKYIYWDGSAAYHFIIMHILSFIN